MGKLFCIFQVNDTNKCHSCERVVDGIFTDTQRRRSYIWSRDRVEDVAPSQSKLGATRNWKRQGVCSTQEPPKDTWPHQHLDFDPVIHFRHLASRAVNKYISVLSHQVFRNFFKITAAEI